MPEIEDTGIAALQFIAGDEKRLERFLGITGLTPQSLRNAAAAPGFFASVLSYLSQNEAELLEFCANAGLDPARVAQLAQNASPPDADFC